MASPALKSDGLCLNTVLNECDSDQKSVENVRKWVNAVGVFLILHSLSSSSLIFSLFSHSLLVLFDDFCLFIFSFHFCFWTQQHTINYITLAPGLFSLGIHNALTEIRESTQDSLLSYIAYSLLSVTMSLKLSPKVVYRGPISNKVSDLFYVLLLSPSHSF